MARRGWTWIVVALALLLASAPALGARVLDAQRGGGGTGTLPGQFAGPDGLGFDVSPVGDVVAADNGNPRLQRFTSTGAFTDEWKVAEPAGPGLPFEVTADRPGAAEHAARDRRRRGGDVWVADGSNGRVQEFDGQKDVLLDQVAAFRAPGGHLTGRSGRRTSPSTPPARPPSPTRSARGS